MSERKVLSKYYPPDFDPAKIARSNRTRSAAGQAAGPRVQTVRLMAPFSMKCSSCGEYIYKGRKFNARKETTDEKYYAISIFRFYIRCTRCSAEIAFKTDPKNMDYECERGAKRNFEVWRAAKLGEETEQERLDRLEREEGERDRMVELERKTLDARLEMEVADALDEVRTRNARRERVGGEATEALFRQDGGGEEQERVEWEIEEEAQRAFMGGTGERVRRLGEGEGEGEGGDGVGGGDGRPSLARAADAIDMPPPTLPTFQRQVKKKVDRGMLLGIKKKPAVLR